MISIIIPTLNEEKYLPLLLDSIKKQLLDWQENYEIIVADAGSKDKTIEIAKKFNCIVVKGGLPAKGRNEGAKIAKGDLLLFLDSDVILPESFFKNSLEEFNSRNLDIAGFCFSFPFKEDVFHYLLDFYNKMVVAIEKKKPFPIIAVLIKKNLFKKIGGYDETIKLSEDREMGERAIKYGKFGIIKSEKVFISDRRFKQDGWMATITKYILSEMHTLFIGPIKSDIFNYKFDHYDKSENEK